MPWMPTQVTKGDIFARYDAHYRDPARRYAALLELRGIDITPGSIVDDDFERLGWTPGLIKTTNVPPTKPNTGYTEQQHVRNDWLGTGTFAATFFRALNVPTSTIGANTVYNVGQVTHSVTPLLTAQVRDGLMTMRKGIIHGLEVSLGLGASDWSGAAGPYLVNGAPLTVVGGALSASPPRVDGPP